MRVRFPLPAHISQNPRLELYPCSGLLFFTTILKIRFGGDNFVHERHGLIYCSFILRLDTVNSLQARKLRNNSPGAGVAAKEGRKPPEKKYQPFAVPAHSRVDFDGGVP